MKAEPEAGAEVPAADPNVLAAMGHVDVARPGNPILISSRLSEPIVSIYVHEGDIVQPGQLLAALEPRIRQASVAYKERKLAKARLELERMQAGFRTEDLRAAEARVQESAAQFRFAQLSYDRLKNLGREVLSQNDLDRALVAFRAAEARHAETVALRDKLKAGYTQVELAIAQADVAEAEAEVEMARLDLADCWIKAPDDQSPLKVLSIQRKVGERLDSNRPSLMELYDPFDLHVRVNLPQREVRHVVPGSKVRIQVEGLTDREYVGRVLHLDPQIHSGRNAVTVRVRIEDPDERLLPEMAAQVRFDRVPDDPPTNRQPLDPPGSSVGNAFPDS